jgi:hypothetical protein
MNHNPQVGKSQQKSGEEALLKFLGRIIPPGEP